MSLRGALSKGSRRSVEATNRLPVPVVPQWRSQLPPEFISGPDKSMELSAYGTVGTLFAIVNRSANSTASVGWDLWRKSSSGLKEDRVKIRRHAAMDLWNRPNPFMSRNHFVEVMQQHVDLTGESAWIVAYDGVGLGMPLELWPVRPDRVVPAVDSYEFIKGYVYQGPDGIKRPLDINEVVRILMPNPSDPFRGLGPVQSIMQDLELNRAGTTYNVAFFRNDATPSGIITVPDTLNDAELKNLREHWEEQYRGVRNAHRVGILEHGDYKQLSFSQRDMQFIEMMGVTGEQIRIAFGFPKPMLGSVDDVNRANAEAAEYVFAKWFLTPRLERIKEALNTQLLPLFGERAANDLEFDYESPVPEDKEFESQSLQARVSVLDQLRTMGVEDDEACDLVDLPHFNFKPKEPVPQQLPGAIPGVVEADVIEGEEEQLQIANRRRMLGR